MDRFQQAKRLFYEGQISSFWRERWACYFKGGTTRKLPDLLERTSRRIGRTDILLLVCFLSLATTMAMMAMPNEFSDFAKVGVVCFGLVALIVFLVGALIDQQILHDEATGEKIMSDVESVEKAFGGFRWVPAGGIWGASHANLTFEAEKHLVEIARALLSSQKRCTEEGRPVNCDEEAVVQEWGFKAAFETFKKFGFLSAEGVNTGYGYYFDLAKKRQEVINAETQSTTHSVAEATS